MAQISYPKPPFPDQQQDRQPGLSAPMNPAPDHGEKTYKGSGKLKGMKAVVTGGDSGIGRAVAIAFAREGADVLIAFLNETEEATEVKKLIEKEGRKAMLVPGDLQDAKHCREVIKKAVDGLGGKVKVVVTLGRSLKRIEIDKETLTTEDTDLVLDGGQQAARTDQRLDRFQILVQRAVALQGGHALADVPVRDPFLTQHEFQARRGVPEEQRQ